MHGCTQPLLQPVLPAYLAYRPRLGRYFCSQVSSTCAGYAGNAGSSPGRSGFLKLHACMTPPLVPTLSSGRCGRRPRFKSACDSFVLDALLHAQQGRTCAGSHSNMPAQLPWQAWQHVWVR